MYLTSRQFLGLRGNALTISLTDFVATAGMFLSQPFWSLYVLSLDASVVDLGLINLAAAIFGAFLMAPMGYLSDRAGRKRPVVISGFIASLGPLTQAVASHWLQLVPGVLLASVQQIVWPIRQSIVADELKPEERISGFATFFMIVMLPSAIMPLFSGYILDAVGLDQGMRIMLLINGSLGLVTSFLRMKFLREEPRKQNSTAQKEGSGIIPLFKEIFEPIIKVRTLQILVLGTWGVMFIFGVMGSFGPVYATEYMGISMTEWGFISTVSGLIGTFMRIPISRITMRLGERNALALSQVGRSLYPIIFVHAQNSLQVLAMNAGYNFAFNLGSPAYQALITEYTPSHQRGRAYGVFGMMWGTLAQVATLLGGAVWETYGPVWTFYSAGLIAYSSTAFLCGWLLLEYRRGVSKDTKIDRLSRRDR